MTTKPICSIEGCTKRVHCRGWCQAHYRLWQKYGVPTTLPRPTLMERFAEKVSVDPSGCHLWTGSQTPLGYGQFWDGERLVAAHRFSYELRVAPIPASLELDHLCRIPACVNPAHLEPVTHLENMRRSSTAMRTHCPQGHPYDETNTYLTKRGHRWCRECGRRRAVEAYARKKATA